MTYFTDAEYFMNFEKDLKTFKLSKQFDILLEKEKTNRAEFHRSAATVNAWYQPETNAVTIPAGILRKPFFDLNYPAAINYGAIGAIIGHEIAHAFDNEGIQFSGRGTLKEWMDVISKKSFDKMAKCVADEYSKFEIAPGVFIDGVNTQKENIADNGGQC